MFLLQLKFLNMEMWKWLMMLVVFIPCIRRDMKEKRIRLSISLIGILVSISLAVFVDSTAPSVIVAGLVPGLILIFISLFITDDLGLGDGIMLLFIGVLFGFKKTILILILSLLLSAIYSLTLLIVRRISKRTTIPFLPFLAMGVGLSFMVVL